MERAIGQRIVQLEVWENEENQKMYEATQGSDLCGGVPFFYNSETGQSICGATTCDNLIKWARGAS
jgi:hypothetical protein